MEDRNDDDANYFSSVLLWSICCNISHLDGREHLVEIQFCYWFSEFALVHHTVEQLPSLHPTPRKQHHQYIIMLGSDCGRTYSSKMM